MIALTLHIELNDATPEGEAAFMKTLAEHLTNENGALVEDFGPEAWGGYEGPTLKRLDVAHNGIVKATWDENYGQKI